MKTIVISDLHLTKRFDEDKFNCLYEIFNNCDRIVLNGDFWSYYSTTFGDFLNSSWRKLFPILIRKKAFYVYGNHDESKWSDSRADNFSLKQEYSYVLKTKKSTYHIHHGHKLLPYRFVQNESYIHLIRLTHFDEIVRYPFESIGERHFGISGRFGKKLNNRIKAHSRKKFDNTNYLVVGHTHSQEVSEDDYFISTGFVEFGVAQYLEITDNAFVLKQKHY